MVGWVRRSRWRLVGVFLFGLLVAGLGAFVAVQYATASSLAGVTPADGHVVPESRVVVSVSLPGFKPGMPVEMLVDAIPVAPDALESVPGAVRALVDLRDGVHWVRVTVDTGNIFSRRLVSQWHFTVDTIAPSIRLAGPEGGLVLPSSPGTLTVQFREEVEATLEVDGAPVTLEGEGTERTARFDVAPGRHEVRVVATDAAGNRSSETAVVWADFSAPRITEVTWPEEVWDEPSAAVVIEAEDDQAAGLEFAFSVDGADVPFDAQVPAGRPDVRRFVVDTGTLSEGEHTLSYRVVDRGGRGHERTATVLVDSSETFGARELSRGARGRDVRELQKVLARRQFYAGEPTGVFDEATSAALSEYQLSRGMAADGTFDAVTLASLLGSIRIDVSERRLYLYDGEDLVRTFPVAVGLPRYPTPKGSFRIISKVYHPSWTPPPSPWAAGLKPVPAGPGNPLGTRWMGLSVPHVGIHGTYASGSIGTAASHGCIRMYIRDVETLFELVYVGTPVEITP